MSEFSKSLFIFRRDLRLIDNTGLNQALRRSQTVIPCFILDPRQLEHNEYKSENAVQFMREALESLARAFQQKSGRLYFLYGEAEKVIAALLDQEKIKAVFVNRDYTPFSVRRDLAITRLCAARQVPFFQSEDVLLSSPGEVLKQGGGAYTVFGAFFRKAQTVPVRPPERTLPAVNFWTKQFSHALLAWPDAIPTKVNPRLACSGSRESALKILKKLKAFKDYLETRDFPALAGTTRLSAPLKFGTCSIREVYAALVESLGPGHPLIRQLYWRDFFTQIAYYFPHVFGEPFYDQYAALRWRNDPHQFLAWCQGRTGVPLVDAGMRELNTTGFMHNRVRMIAASFLVKDLHMDWRWGEKYFATQLVDYDPAVNNGNWQWISSTGCDVQPYFRIFNPWRQLQRYDVKAEYVKTWIPELCGLSATEICRLGSNAVERPSGYPAPLVDHAQESEQAKMMYRHVQRASRL